MSTTWTCAICGCYWWQPSGVHVQTHYQGCPNIRAGDLVRPKASNQDSESRPDPAREPKS